MADTPGFTSLLTPGSKLAVPVEFMDPQAAEFAIESRRCKSITSKFNGRTYPRSEDPRDRWADLYRRAKLDPNEFELEMEPEEMQFFEVDGDEGVEHHPKLTVGELQGMNMNKLREIGKAYGVTSNRKDILIQGILKRQSDIISKAKGL